MRETIINSNFSFLHSLDSRLLLFDNHIFGSIDFLHTIKFSCVQFIVFITFATLIQRFFFSSLSIHTSMNAHFSLHPWKVIRFTLPMKPFRIELFFPLLHLTTYNSNCWRQIQELEKVFDPLRTFQDKIKPSFVWMWSKCI